MKRPISGGIHCGTTLRVVNLRRGASRHNMLVWLAATLIATTATRADEPTAPDRMPDAEFVISATSQSVRCRVHIDVDGQHLDDFSRPRLDTLFDHLDRDGNQRLDADELAALPSPGFLRRAMWGYLPANSPAPVPLNDVDSDRDGAITSEEFRAWLVRNGIGRVSLAGGESAMTPSLTDALWRLLDSDRDGRLSATELTAAPNTLRKLDDDDDELVSARELVASVTQPYPFATTRVAESRFEIVGDSARETTLPKSDLLIVARLSLKSSNPGTITTSPSAETPSDTTISLPLGEISSVIATRIGTATRWRERIEALAAQHFESADHDHDHAITRDEAARATTRTIGTLFDWLDRDRNGRVTDTEWSTALGVLEQLSQTNVQLSLLSHRAALFELFDEDRDGSLAARESRRLAERFPNGLNRENLPTLLTLFASLGQPLANVSSPSPNAPRWFTAMDSNRDGLVSPAEFRGSRDQFSQLDTNHDGQLSASELPRVESKKQ